MPSTFSDHAPILHFHWGEKYFPVTIHDYIINSKLVYEIQGERPIVLLENISHPNEIVTGHGLDDVHLFQKEYYLELKNQKELNRGCEWFVKNNTVNKELLTRTPVFYTFTFENVMGYIDVVYVVPYCYNGTLMSHSYDSECVTIRFNKETHEPVSVALSSHEGYHWYKYTDFEIVDGRIKVYVANGSHAMYPDPKTRMRFFGIGNDNLSIDGWDIKMDCMFVENTVQKLSKETAYLGFTGKRSKDLDERFVPAERKKMDVVDYPSPIHSLDYIKKGLTRHRVPLCILVCLLLLIAIAFHKIALTLIILTLVITLYTNS
jgi:hypothetical protein